MVTGVFNYYLKYYGALHLLEHLNHFSTNIVVLRTFYQQ